VKRQKQSIEQLMSWWVTDLTRGGSRGEGGGRMRRMYPHRRL